MDFLISLQSVGLLIALAIPGYVLKKTNMIPSGAAGVLVVILMYVSLPFLTLSSFMKKTFAVEFLAALGVCLVLSVFLLIAAFLISAFCFALIDRTKGGTKKEAKEDAAKKVCLTAGYMNNCAFMGIPVLQAFFPGDGEPVIYCAVFGIAFNIIGWTLSTYTITGDKKHISLKNGFLNPPTAVLALALPLFFAGFTVPVPALTGIDFLGNMTSPLSMMIMGIRLADIKIADLFKSARVYLSAAVKLAVVPLFTFAVLLPARRVIPLNDTLFITLYVIMAMPSASSVIMFSEMFGGDNETAVKCILLSSVVSVLTIPVLMLLCRYL
jgi:predicted permease